MKPTFPLLAQSTLKKLGRDIKLARVRRRISTQLMAERAGISRTTLNKLEKGSPTVSLGAFIRVLFVLGLLEQFAIVFDAQHDVVGLDLAEENLPKRIRYSEED